MSYRDDVEALRQRCEMLEHEVSTSTRDLEDARRLLAEARERRRLPVLENLHVAAPCSVDWGKMSGDDRSRHCSACDKNVYNLSNMTRAEAETLLLEREGELCVRYYQRADGTILTADCPVGQTRRRRRRRVVAAAFGAVSALTAAGALLHRGSPVRATMGAIAQPTPALSLVAPPEPTPPVMVMGEIAPRQPMMGTVSMGHQTVKMGKMKMNQGQIAVNAIETKK